MSTFTIYRDERPLLRVAVYDTHRAMRRACCCSQSFSSVCTKHKRHARRPPATVSFFRRSLTGPVGLFAVIHEVSHAVDFICETLGQTFYKPDGWETRAYLAEHLTYQILLGMANDGHPVGSSIQVAHQPHRKEVIPMAKKSTKKKKGCKC